jgi:hypothetical protein
MVGRDSKTYFGVLLDDNNRRPIARLWFTGSNQYLGGAPAEAGGFEAMTTGLVQPTPDEQHRGPGRGQRLIHDEGGASDRRVVEEKM